MVLRCHASIFFRFYLRTSLLARTVLPCFYGHSSFHYAGDSLTINSPSFSIEFMLQCYTICQNNIDENFTACTVDIAGHSQRYFQTRPAFTVIAIVISILTKRLAGGDPIGWWRCGECTKWRGNINGRPGRARMHPFPMARANSSTNRRRNFDGLIADCSCDGRH